MAIALGGNQINKAYLGTTEIQKMYLGSELVFNNSIQPIGLTPIMTNFRVESGQPSRVYFDTPNGEPVGLATSGFTISNNTITGLDTGAKYFSVGTPFTHYSNNSIRLESGNGVIYDFTMEPITNNIAEPVAASEEIRYAASSTQGSGNGLDEANAWSYSTAFSSATAGMTVYLKVGNSSTVLTLGNSGTLENPIKFIGYKTTREDITSNYYTPKSDNWSTSEMPTITGPSRSSSRGLSATSKSYVIIKNLQVTNTNNGIYQDRTTNVVLKRCNVKEIGDTYNYNFVIFGDFDDANDSIHSVSSNRLVDCKSKNSSGETFGAYSSGVLFDSCDAYCDELTGTATGISTDYYFSIRGSNNIIKNSECYRESRSVPHEGHGFTVKSEIQTYPNKVTSDIVECEYNLVVDSYTYLLGGGVEARNPGVNYNVFKRIHIESTYDQSGYDNTAGRGVRLVGGAKYNTFESLNIQDVGFAIEFYNNVESERTGKITEGNIFQNCIINGAGYGIEAHSESTGDSIEINNNKFLNNVYYNIYSMHGLFTHEEELTYSGNEYVNCIFNNITELDRASSTEPTTDAKFSFDYCNFFDAFTARGANQNTTNPNFVDTTNFIPQNNLDAPKIGGINYDIAKLERSETTTIGANEINEVETPPVTGANLLFKSDFEGSVVLGELVGGQHQYFSGSSLGYTFPTDGQLGMGSSNNNIHAINDGDPLRCIARLETVTGHLGGQTTALYQQVNTSTGNTQIPWEFDNLTNNPDEFYMSYWIKFGAGNLLDANRWHAMWEYKTDNYTVGDNSGGRFYVGAGKHATNGDYFIMQFDSDPGTVIWDDVNYMTIPRDEWFKFEVYIKFTKDNTGAAFIKINDVKILEQTNVVMTRGDNDIDFFITAQLYGGSDIEQWIDDVEFWDGIPDETPPSNLYLEGDAADPENETETIGANWDSANVTQYAVDAAFTPPYNGIWLLRGRLNSDGPGRCWLNTSFDIGEQLEIKVALSVIQSTTASVHDWTGFSVSPDQNITNTDWQIYTFNVVVTAATQIMQFWSSRSGGITGDVLNIDDFSIVKTA